MFYDLLKSSSSLGICCCFSLERTITDFLIMLLSPSSPSFWTYVNVLTSLQIDEVLVLAYWVTLLMIHFLLKHRLLF